MILFFLICWKNIRNTKKRKRKKNDRFIRSPKIEQLISYTGRRSIQDTTFPVAGRIASFFSFFDTVHFHLR